MNVPFTVLLLFSLVLLVGLTLAFADLKTLADGSKQGLEVGQKIFLGHTSIPIQKEEQLTFHQIHFRQRKAKPIKSLHHGIPSPVFVFGARVIQVLSRENQRSKEDAVDGATHALGDRGQARS